jgi:hypothetical protein
MIFMTSEELDALYKASKPGITVLSATRSGN